MLPLAGLLDELERSAPARAAMAMIEAALARRSVAEQGAFWHAVDLYYIARKAPPEPTAAGPSLAGAQTGPGGTTAR